VLYNFRARRVIFPGYFFVRTGHLFVCDGLFFWFATDYLFVRKDCQLEVGAGHTKNRNTKGRSAAGTNSRGNFSTNLSPSGRIRQVQNTTSCQNSGMMNLNSIRISTVRGHAPYKYPPRNTMSWSPSTNSNPLRISWSDTFFSPTVEIRVEKWVGTRRYLKMQL